MNLPKPYFRFAILGALLVPLSASEGAARTRARTNLNLLVPPPAIGCVLSVIAPTYVELPFTVTITVANPEWVTRVNIAGGDVVPPAAPGSPSYSRQLTAPYNQGVYPYTGFVEGPAGRMDCPTLNVNVILPPPPTCTLTANPSRITYDCGRLVSGSTVSHSVNGIMLTSIIFNGAGQTLTPLVHSIWTVSPANHTGSVANRGGANNCAPNPLYVGMRCACPPGIVAGEHANNGWGYHYCVDNPPTCSHNFHCEAVSCLGQVGGQDVDRGCFRGGCFAPESLIRMADGSSRRADLVAAGDQLWNPVQKRGFPVFQRVVGPEALPLLLIGYGDVVVKVTTTHPMVTLAGLKKAEDVTLKDSVLGADLKFHRVNVKRDLPRKSDQVVYNFRLGQPSEVTEDHLIVSDGIVTGDHYLQESLAIVPVP